MIEPITKDPESYTYEFFEDKIREVDMTRKAKRRDRRLF